MARIYSILFLLLFNNISFSQNYESDADNELQEVLKNYSEFNIDSLQTKQYKFIKGFNIYTPQYNSRLIERDIDFGWKETIYFFGIQYFNNQIEKSKDYLIHIFTEKNSTVGIIVNDVRIKNKKYYFENDKLKKYVKRHNDFYKTNSNVENFVNDFTTDSRNGTCGQTTYIPPRYKDLEYNLSNIKIFEKMLKSYNPELQSDAVRIYEYLINEKLIPKREGNKFIKNIKERNSLIIVCAGIVKIF